MKIQVTTVWVGSHPALRVLSIILSLEGDAPTVVYVEGLVGDIYLERPQDIERYQQVSEILRA